MSTLVLENCALVDVDRGVSTGGARIVVEGNTITAAGPADAVSSPADARRLDLGGRYVAPGLINCHVHFGLILPGAAGDALRGESDAARALRMASNARQTLEIGVTTVRLVSERQYTDLDLRASIARGETVGPRIFTAGPLLIATGGHGWELDGTLQADGADGFLKAARTQLRHGVDLLKISVSGGIAGENEAIADPQMEAEEIRAVTRAAHARGKKVAAHAGPPRVIELAVECGVDTIEHGYFLDAQAIETMNAHGAWLVPTVNVSRATEFYERIGAPAWMVARALEAGKQHWAALEQAIAGGVAIALGTDMMPQEPFDGTNVTARELEFYVEAGMTAAEALRSATASAAAMLGVDTIGRVRPGCRADLIVLDDDPTVDISAVRNVRLVMSDGRLAHDPLGLAR
ncbi:MAG: amidohydrolase family protein [Gaiellales bacterium]